jgi:hypothetical protein
VQRNIPGENSLFSSYMSASENLPPALGIGNPRIRTKSHLKEIGNASKLYETAAVHKKIWLLYPRWLLFMTQPQ